MHKVGDLKNITVPTWNYKIPYNYGITKEEARKTSYELFQKYFPNIEGEYELVNLTGNMEKDEASYIWYATFYKKYGELLNSYERISVNFVPTINGLYQLVVERGKFENNEIKISKEEAIKIAESKDKEIEPNREIENISVEERIEKMNAEVYLRQTDKEKYENEPVIIEDGYYVTDDRVRRIWMVNLEYKKETGKIDSYTYFVDTTTGEIIGGAKYNLLDN